ncbi:MAG: DpnD/PcfM family protein [Bacteroidetes bacterium]|nr:DpnD/PcfM family protein [Bacteroidota bacterium]MBU1117221.1 DpnD/PcfM family protein [Bacteroidota bacterium]MBU1800143.1 DpnD/PcfM family protein [Bacteroidota bacterium]
MKTFKYEIQETLSRIIEVEAQTEDEAYLIIKEMYSNEEIVLDSSDYIDTEIKEFEDE